MRYSKFACVGGVSGTKIMPRDPFVLEEDDLEVNADSPEMALNRVITSCTRDQTTLACLSLPPSMFGAYEERGPDGRILMPAVGDQLSVFRRVPLPVCLFIRVRELRSDVVPDHADCNRSRAVHEVAERKLVQQSLTKVGRIPHASIRLLSREHLPQDDAEAV